MLLHRATVMSKGAFSLLLLSTLCSLQLHGAHALQGPNPTLNCSFNDYIRHEGVTSWEFQMDVPSEKLASLGANRKEVLAAVAGALREMAYNPELDLMVVPDSLRTSVFDQLSIAVTTLDGKPLFPSRDTPDSYPWNGPGFIRYRRKHAMFIGLDQTNVTFLPEVQDSLAAEAHPELAWLLHNDDDDSVGLRPGHADITLKLKDVNLDDFELPHELLDFPEHPHRSGRHKRHTKFKWKIENDRYCVVGRPTYEAMFHPISMRHTNMKTLRDVDKYFPHMSKYLGYSDRAELPLYNERFFSKSVWDVRINGVHGVANWIESYDNLLDALSGVDPLISELSFRLKRVNIEKDTDSENIEEPLDAMAAVCQAMHDQGWDTGVH